MKDNSNSSIDNDGRTGASAYLSPLAVVALSFGYAVGWGAFVLPGTVFLPKAGPVGTLIGVAIGTVVMAVFAFNYHRLVVRRQGSSGAYGFVAKAFGTDHGYLVTWFLLLTYVAILWSNSTSLVISARYFLGDMLQFGFHYTMFGFDVYFGEVLLCVAAVVLCGGLCLFSRRLSVQLLTLFAGVMVVGIATCFFAALFRHGGGIASMAPAFASEGSPVIQVLRILAMIPWAFVGFEAVVHSSAEFRFPVKRTLSLMIVAIILSAFAYIALAVLPVLSFPEWFATWPEYIAVLPELKGPNSLPVFVAARQTLGAAGTAILGGSMLAAQLTGIFATFVTTSRLMRAMSHAGMIPRWFGVLNSDRTPANAVIFVMLVSCAVPFFGRTVTGWSVDASSLGATIAYGYVSAAAYVIARREGGDRFVRLAGLAGVVMAVAFSLLMFVPNYLSGDSLSAGSYLLLSVWCLLGFLMYRRVFRLDSRGRFGHSTVVWVSVLVIIFFSSLMWFRLAVCDSVENIFDNFKGRTFGKKELVRLVSHVDSDMLLKSVVELALLVSSLAIMLSLFSILRKREKNLIIQKLEAEKSANKSKSYFFSTVSHDIRTPLNAIIGFSQMLRMGFRSDAERDQAIDSIMVSGKTLLHLVNNVLDFSKLEDGSMEIVPEPTDCGKLVRELVETFRIANKVPAVEFRCRVDGLPILMVDPQRVRQLLFNLMGNAAKFTESGFVEVRATFARNNGADIGTFRLEVEDTGCGISEDDLKIIASPYVQVGSKLARHGGTGLGLAICRQLAAAMGGELSIASTLGKGSTFVVSVPNVKVRDALPAAEPSGAPVAAHENKRILIVDDQKMNLTVLKAMLKKLGYLDVMTADDGKQALAALESGGAMKFERVLTDMWMPELDGEGLVRAIRANDALAKLPVHVITADVEMLAKSEAVGFDGILLKPVTVDKLREIL